MSIKYPTQLPYNASSVLEEMLSESQINFTSLMRRDRDKEFNGLSLLASDQPSQCFY